MPNTITPKLWTNGLFDAATEVDPSAVKWDGDGWNLYTACPAGAVWCCEDSDADPVVPKKDPAVGGTIKFKPFTVYQITGCPAGTSRLPANMAMNEAHVNSWLTVNVEGWVSAGLELGACESPGLVDLEDVTPGTGTLTVMQAISRLLENRVRDGLFDRPTVHLPAATIPSIADHYDNLLRFVDIAVGSGYGVVNPEDTTGWAYITGGVEYSLGSRSIPTDADVISVRRRNYDEAMAEQIAVVRFDPCGGYRAQFTY